MPALFECRDPFGRTIQIDERRWYAHITRYHPLLNDHLESVRLAIMEPTGIYEDANDPAIDCFYKFGAVSSHPGHYLKVCIGPGEDDKNGFVITAYVTPRIKGSEIQKWPTP